MNNPKYIKYIVYGLIDPITRLIRYVGCSKRNKYRPAAHRCPANLKRKTHTAAWVRSLIAKGLDYDVVILDQLESPDAVSAAEIWWIAYGRGCGWDLTNHTDGGEGALGYVASSEARAKLSAAHKGRRASDETRARMREAAKGRPPASDETRELIRQSKLGKPRPDLVGKPNPGAAKFNSERTQSPEEIEKRRATLYGNKRGAANKGRVYSEESLQRMREGQARRRAREHGE